MVDICSTTPWNWKKGWEPSPAFALGVDCFARYHEVVSSKYRQQQLQPAYLSFARGIFSARVSAGRRPHAWRHACSQQVEGPGILLWRSKCTMSLHSLILKLRSKLALSMYASPSCCALNYALDAVSGRYLFVLMFKCVVFFSQIGLMRNT